MANHGPSRFIFEELQNVRVFRHQPCINNTVLNCVACQNYVGKDEPYSHHWLTKADGQHIKLSLAEKVLLRRIEKERIETFMLCDESAVSRSREFLEEASLDAVPQLLRFLFYEASHLKVTIGFYVNVANKRLYYETFPMTIKHFLDVDIMVDMAFTSLFQKISSYVLYSLELPMEACAIKRMKLNVQRQWNGKLHLPLQYGVKSSTRDQQKDYEHPVDLPYLIESFVNYHGRRHGHFPSTLRVNLYCFRVCPRTRELYTVPYLLRSEDVDNTPTFLIQSDVAGEFLGLHQIQNIRRFLRADPRDNIIECRECKSNFAGRLQYALHKEVECGRGILCMTLNMDEDVETTELHERCFPLPKQFFNSAWFGIAYN